MKSKKEVNKKGNFEKELKKEIQEVEKWILERRKFLIKLAWVVGFVSVLLIVSKFYLRVSGVEV